MLKTYIETHEARRLAAALLVILLIAAEVEANQRELDELDQRQES